MRVSGSISLASLFTVLAACGGGEDEAVPATPPVVDPAAVGTPPGAPETPPTTVPEGVAPTGGPTLADRIAGSTRVVPAPSTTPETTGSFSLVAEPCTLDGPEIVGDDTFTTVGPVAWGSDGALYLIDQDGRVRRYTITPGAACVLAMDTTFGEGGRMSFGDDVAQRPRSIAADAAGHVYVSSSMGGTDRLTGTHRDYHCDTRGNVVVSSDGTLGFALFGAGPIRRIAFTDGNCSVEDWRAVELPSSVNAVAFVSPSRLLVGGSAGSGAPTLARLYAVDGSPTGAAFGDTDGELSAPDHFCWVHGAVACGAGLCVLDGNCRDLRVFDADNVALGSIDLMHLFGVSYPWVSGLTEFRERVAYATVSQERETNDVYDGLVFRVRQP